MATFKFLPKGSYKKKVKVLVPSDFGKADEVEFTVEFRQLKHSERRDLLKQIGEAAKSVGDSPDLDVSILRANVIGWEGLPSDEVGVDMTFSADNLSAMLDVTCYVRALASAFVEDVINPTGAARKN